MQSGSTAPAILQPAVRLHGVWPPASQPAPPAHRLCLVQSKSLTNERSGGKGALLLPDSAERLTASSASLPSCTSAAAAAPQSCGQADGEAASSGVTVGPGVQLSVKCEMSSTQTHRAAPHPAAASRKLATAAAERGAGGAKGWQSLAPHCAFPPWRRIFWLTAGLRRPQAPEKPQAGVRRGVEGGCGPPGGQFSR